MFVLSDRVKETSFGVGSGNIVLTGPFTSFQSFSGGIGDGNTTYYAIENDSRWEVGQGTYSLSTNSLSRDIIFDSSESGNRVSLTGISFVFCTLPAKKSLVKDPDDTVTLSGIYFSDTTFQNTAGGGGGGGESLFTQDIVVSLAGGKTFGRYSNGQVIPASGLSAVQVVELATAEAQDPVATLSASLTTVETGTSSISVTLSYGYTINNPGASVSTVSLEFSRGNGAWTVLSTDTGLTSYVHNIVGNVSSESINYRYIVTDSLAYSDTATDSVVFSYKVFYGSTASVPVSSADVRALPSNRFLSGNTWELSTGSTNINFAVAMPNTQAITEVLDLDALNANITSQYINGPFDVNDAGGVPVAYNVYVMTVAIPYSSNHRHRITKA
jgi:hypothetical protein